MASKPLRIGVIGLGFGSKVHIPGLLAEGMEVVAVCARHKENADEVASKFGIPNVFTNYEDLLRLDGLDAVSIATPRFLHYPMTMAAITAGKHVLCEKPLAMNVLEAREMLDSGVSAGLTTMVNHQMRFSPSRQYLKKLVEEGFIGELRNVHISLYLSRTQLNSRPMKWSSLHAEGGGFLTGHGSHFIDCIRHWFGEISGVSGRMFAQDTRRWDSTKQQVVEADTDDAFGCIFTLQNGAWGSISGNLLTPFGSRVEVEVHGSDGVLELQRRKGNGLREVTLFGANVADDKDVHEITIPNQYFSPSDSSDVVHDAFRSLVRLFQQGITQGISPSPNFYDGLRCQQVLDGISKSSEEGQWVSIPPS